MWDWLKGRKKGVWVRHFIICRRIPDGEKGVITYLDSFYKLKDAVIETPEDRIYYLGYKDGDDMKNVHVVAVWSRGLKALFRPKMIALGMVEKETKDTKSERITV